MLSWQSRIEPIQKTERHKQHRSLMAEPAIHDGDLAFDADASSCAILPCTSAFSLLLLHAKLGNPCNWRLALAWCLINSTLVTQKAPDLPKHLAWFQCTYLRPIGNSKSTWESREVLQCLQFMIWKKSNHRLQIKQVRHVERILKNSFAPSYLIGWWNGNGRLAPSSNIIVQNPLLSHCSPAEKGRGMMNWYESSVWQ